MEAALNLRNRARGADLLLAHCCLLGRLEDTRPPVSARLEQELGPELARLLLHALALGQRRRGSSSP